jgi:hypothetical protein
MSATSRTLSYDALLSTTADKIHASGAVQNAISNSNPTFGWLTQKGKVKKMAVGGDQIRVNLMYELNPPTSYSGYEQINIDPNDGVTVMYVPWAQYGKGVSISGIERFKNMGKEQIANLLTTKITQTTQGWAETLNAHIWDVASLQTSAHPYTGNSGKDVIGIPLYVQGLGATDHPSGAGSTADMTYDIGHIDQGAETWWQNKIGTPAGDTWKQMNAAMRNLYNNCSQGPGGAPDLLVGDQVSFEIYENGMDEKTRYNFTDKASVGFESIAFKGKRFFWDGYVPDMETPGDGALSTGSALAEGSIFFLNTNTLSLYMGRDHDFKPRGFQTPVDQDASTSLYLAYLQLVCTDRRKNGVLYAIEPTINA